MKLWISSASILLTLCSARSFAEPLKLDPRFSKVVATCKPSKNSSTTVYFFKQWHLSSGVNTKDHAKPYPQEKNLESIYLQLDEWIKNKKNVGVVVEGCAGTLDESSSYRVNGWTIQDLKEKKTSADFKRIGTSVPLKLKAKYGEQVVTVCGDTDALVKEHLLAFSDARGESGFLTRISQYKDEPARLKPYLDDAIQLFKLPKTASYDDVIAALKTKLKKTIQHIQEITEKRNKNVVDTIVSMKLKNISVVYGGIHTEGVKRLLEENGINCFIIEPLGYQNDETQLLKQLEEAVQKI